MASMCKEVLRVLLDTLMEKELIAGSQYDGAVALVNAHMDLPDFFRDRVCCQEENENGSPEDQK